MSSLKNTQDQKNPGREPGPSQAYRLFIDLDGVLVDFNSGVKSIFGRQPDDIPPAVLWPRLAKTAGFYDKLDWTADGRGLWDYVKAFGPIILTGLPRGSWAEPQKRSWCARELGPDIPVITCLSREKHLLAAEACHENEIPLLVDDSLKLKDAWEEFGGIFIHHKSAAASIETLRGFGFTT